jgi:hypothetical protein
MDSTNNDFVDMLGEHTRERATECDSGCSPRELLWVDIFLRTNSVLKANQAAGYAGTDRPPPIIYSSLRTQFNKYQRET